MKLDYKPTINDIVIHDNEMARILKFSDKNKIQIEYLSSEQELFYIVDLSSVYLEQIDTQFLINLTNSTESVHEVILRPTRTDSMYYSNDSLYNIYHSIYESIDEISVSISHELNMDIHCQNQICHFVAVNCFLFLYEQNCYYRIECMFGNTYLNMFNPWQHYLKMRVKKLQYNENKMNNNELPEMWELGEYVCIICKVRPTQYDFVFGCNCIGCYCIDSTHHFCHVVCISCIYTTIIQSNSLELLLETILKNKLYKNCIKEIITFCIGEVNLFNMFKDKQNVNNKRCIKTNNDMPRKKRRIK